jgi:hypothetical protein
MLSLIDSFIKRNGSYFLTTFFFEERIVRGFWSSGSRCEGVGAGEGGRRLLALPDLVVSAYQDGWVCQESWTRVRFILELVSHVEQLITVDLLTYDPH